MIRGTCATGNVNRLEKKRKKKRIYRYQTKPVKKKIDFWVDIVLCDFAVLIVKSLRIDMFWLPKSSQFICRVGVIQFEPVTFSDRELLVVRFFFTRELVRN